MLMQPRTSAGLKVALKEGDARAVWLAFELDGGDGASPLIATIAECWTFILLGMLEVACLP